MEYKAADLWVDVHRNSSEVNSRSVTEHSDRVDAVRVESTALEEGTVVTELHTLTGVVTALEHLHPVVFSVLRDEHTHTS